MNKNIYPLLSGGIDSTIAILKRISTRDFGKLQPIFINYGQKACEQEWNSTCSVSEKIAKLLEDDKIIFLSPKRIDLSFPHWSTKVFHWSRSKLITGNLAESPYVENRNLILLSIAASFVESQIEESDEGIIVTGFRDEYPDTKREFVAFMNCLLAFLLHESKKSIKIEAPIIDYGPDGKRKMIKDFQRYNDIIRLTWSCYNPVDGNPCLKCEACVDRKQALG